MQAGLVNLHFRVFAITDMGLAVFSSSLQSQGMGLARSQIGSIEHLEAQAMLMRSLPDDSEGMSASMRQNIWQPVVDELAKLEIETSPDELAAMDFEIIPTREVRLLFD